MRHATRRIPLALALAALAWTTACGDGGNEAERADAEAESAGPELTIPEPMLAFEDDGDVLEIRIEADDRMRFDTDQFTVGAGQMVRLTLVHVGSLPAQSMGHNVVIIQQGDDAIDFGTDANEQGADVDNDFVPEPVRDRVIAYTELVGGGETTTIEFRAPEEPGDYPFLCSFPGHFMQMNGQMVVEER